MKYSTPHFLTLLFLTVGLMAFSQVGVGTTTPEGALDVVSSNSGLVLPRVATTAAVTTPVDGMMVYDISSTCPKVYENGTWSDCLSSGSGIPAGGGALAAVFNDCDLNGFSGTFTDGVALSNASFSVTITNNTFSNASVNIANSDLVFSGVTGIMVNFTSITQFVLIPGQSKLVTYNLTGMPNGTGTLTANWNNYVLSCTRSVAVN
jgi:hypothetical protein